MIFPLVWFCVIFISLFSGYFDLYVINSNALLIYIFGAFVFSLTSIFFDKYIEWVIPVEKIKINNVRYDRLYLFFVIISMIAIPLIINTLSTYGSTFSEIAYKVRQASVSGETIIPAYLSNYFILGGFIIPIISYGYFSKKFKAKTFFFLFVSYGITNLFFLGRSSLIVLIFSLIYIYILSGNKLNIKFVIFSFLFFFVISYFGATLVKKVSVDNGNTILLVIENIFNYAIQGPILFSRYVDGSISIKENWDTLNSVCHVFSFLGWCEPIPKNADFSYFGFKSQQYGNVYTYYFSIIPKYSYLGLTFFTVFYSLLCNLVYRNSIRGGVLSIVYSSLFFSYIILTIFSDEFGYSFWLCVKFFIFYIVIFKVFGFYFVRSIK